MDGGGARLGRFVAGDPLRGLAAMAVVAWHAAYLSLAALGLHTGLGPHLDTSLYYGHPVGDVLRAGSLSVYLFFVLSGYLIGRPFVRAYVAGAPRPRVRSYARNRIFRIYPIFIVSCLILLAIYGLDGETVPKTINIMLLGDTARVGWGSHIQQMWSLKVEVAFYAMLPLALFALAFVTRPVARRVPPWGRAVIIGVPITLLGAFSLATHWDEAIYATLPGEFWAFVPGLLLATIEPFAMPAVRDRPRAVRTGLVLTVAGFVVMMTYLPAVRTLGPGWGKLIAVISTGMLVGGPLLAEWTGMRPWRAFDNRVLHWLGERSYPIFLVHWALLFEIAPLFDITGPKKTLAVVWPLTLAITLVLADILHRLVERPFMRRKKRTVPTAEVPEPVVLPDVAPAAVPAQTG